MNTLRDVHFYDVVPQEQLLARLALDSGRPAIASGITQLLIRSFLPQGVRGVELYKRAVKFLQSSHAAAFAFYSHVHEHVPLPNIAKLILVLQKGSNYALKKMCGGGGAKASKAATKKRGLDGSASFTDSVLEEGSDGENKDGNGEEARPINTLLTARVQKVCACMCVMLLWSHL